MDRPCARALPRVLLSTCALALACGGDDMRRPAGTGVTSLTTSATATATATASTSATGGESDASSESGGTSSGGGTSAGSTSSAKFDVGGQGTGDDATGQPCTNLECQIPTCPQGQETTLKGKVFAPEGTLPLYNVVVYVPNAPLAPIPNGVYCNTCNDALTGEPIVAALTDTKGEFVLKNVPAGANIPLVITIGKWRRQITVANVEPCAETVADGALTRLPRNQGEGDMPRIATATGGADALECLLRRIGIADEEFSPENGPGKVNLYRGTGGTSVYTQQFGGEPFTPATTLWEDPSRLDDYDMLVLSCEGTPDGKNKSAQARQNIVDYADAGGRVFISHWHNVWIEEGAASWPTAAIFDHKPDLPSPFVATLDTSFPKGKAMAEWLVNVDGTDPYGQITIKGGQDTIDSVNPAVSTRWIYADNPKSIQYFTFNTPIGAPTDQQCGRVVDTDIHVTSAGIDSQVFPNNCPPDGTPLTPQEKVLMFVLFELGSCLIPDDEEPMIPG